MFLVHSDESLHIPQPLFSSLRTYLSATKTYIAETEAIGLKYVQYDLLVPREASGTTPSPSASLLGLVAGQPWLIGLAGLRKGLARAEKSDHCH